MASPDLLRSARNPINTLQVEVTRLTGCQATVQGFIAAHHCSSTIASICARCCRSLMASSATVSGRRLGGDGSRRGEASAPTRTSCKGRAHEPPRGAARIVREESASKLA